MSYESSENPSNEAASAAASAATLPPPPAPTPTTVTGGFRHQRPARRFIAVVATVGAIFVGAVLFVVAITAALVVGVIAGFAIDGDTEEISHLPTTVEEIPTSITAERADIVVDLTALSAEDFADRSEPLAIDIDIDAGAVEVIVPEGLTMSVDADTSVGSTTVFDRENNGFDNRITVEEASADIALTIDIDAGDIDVERG
ncbi:MAG: LiaF domain-containing protein [Actinomycetota bacterium]